MPGCHKRTFSFRRGLFRIFAVSFRKDQRQPFLILTADPRRIKLASSSDRDQYTVTDDRNIYNELLFGIEKKNQLIIR
jgi:hypothetical protein